mgnify:FL=1|jgi:hypothetical protein
MPLQKMDVDTKMEVIINLAFGVPIKMIATKYDIAEYKIVNLRKNNYKLYNQISESFYIVDEVAVLGLSPLYERAVNVVKRAYGKRFQIINEHNFALDGEKMSISKVLEVANTVIARDEIPPLQQIPNIKNYYQSNRKMMKRSRKCRTQK